MQIPDTQRPAGLIPGGAFCVFTFFLASRRRVWRNGLVSPRIPAMPHDRSRVPRDVDTPRAGFFLIKLVKGGPLVPAAIMHDFGAYWAVVNGRAHRRVEDPLKCPHIERIWHHGAECDQAEYQRILADPDRPNPRIPIDLNKLDPLF